MRRGPFIKAASLAMALHTAFAPAAWAGGAKVAVLRPSPVTPSAEAAWAAAVEILRRDPAVPLLDDLILQERLNEWRVQEAAALEARSEAAQVWNGRITGMLSSAREDYYRFSYASATGILQEAAALLSNLGDSGTQADLLYEISLLEGMCILASGGENAGSVFARAVALRPQADLPEVRFSPAVREQYDLVRTVTLAQGRSRLSVSGKPAGAAVLLDGVELGRVPVEEAKLLPGRHFLEVRSEGRTVDLQTLEVLPHAELQVKADLAVLPGTDDPGGFYARRFLEGERGALGALMGRIGVDYLVLGREIDSGLEAWLLDGTGQAVSSVVVPVSARQGQDGPRELAEMVGIYARASLPEGLSMGYTALPEAPSPSAQEPPRRSRWQVAAAGLALVLLAVLSTSGGDDGGTKVEVSW